MKKNLTQLFEEFINECRFSSRLSPETIRGYKDSFKLLMMVMPNLEAELISPAIMTEFFKRLENREREVGRGIIKQGIKTSTVATYRSKLNKFFSWLKIRGQIKENPFISMPYPDVNYEDKKYLDKKAVEKIFMTIEFSINWQNELVKKRNKAIFSMLLYCGLRKNEFINIKMLDIDLKNNILAVNAQTSKSKIRREIPLNSTVTPHLNDYILSRNQKKYETPYLFVSDNRDDKLTTHGIKHLVEKINKESGVKFTLHQFRHTFAINMLNMGCEIAKLKQLMGHKDIRMTAVYLRCIPTTAMKRDVEMLTLDNLV